MGAGLLDGLYSKSLNLHPLSLEEGVRLWHEAPLDELMAVAGEVRWLHNLGREVTWQIDRNINITNVCSCGCLFCNFHCSVRSPRAYVLGLEEYVPKIEELLAAGGDQVLLQGGLHPALDLDYYCSLFSQLKGLFPTVRLHALGPPEVVHIAKMAGLDVETTLRRLVEAGLDSLPGAGAEILSDRVRAKLSPRKASVAEWLGVMRIAHRMGLLTSATMMYGHLETVEERVGHLLAVRGVQQEALDGGAEGFKAFIPWPVQRGGTLLERYYPAASVSPSEHLRLLALARLMLHNVQHLQASWLTVGPDVARLSLRGGADDMGSIMIEERVVASTGCSNSLDAVGMQALIRQAGFVPQLRDQGYNPRCLPCGL